MKRSTKLVFGIVSVVIVVFIFGTFLLIKSLFATISQDDVVQIFNSNKKVFVNSVIYILNSDQKNIYSESYEGGNQDVEYLLNDLEYRGINSTNNELVFFVRESSWGFNQGILFSKQVNEPDKGNYFTKLENLDENWYFFKMK